MNKSLFLLILLLSSTVSTPLAFAQQVNPYTPTPCPQRAGCQTIELSFSDVDRLLDLLFLSDSSHASGIEGGELTGETLNNPDVIVTDESGENAADEKVPSQEINPLNFFLSNQTCNGPYSIASRVKSDVRVSQCKYADSAVALERCEGVSLYKEYADDPILKVKETMQETGTLPEQDKENNFLTGGFESRMLCSSNDTCNFVIYSQYEKAFNFTASMVDVSTMIAPIGKAALTSKKIKFLGGKSVLQKLKLVGDKPRNLPIVNRLVKNTYPDNFNDDIAEKIGKNLGNKEYELLQKAGYNKDALKSVSNINKAIDQERLLQAQIRQGGGTTAGTVEDIQQRITVLDRLKGDIAGLEEAKFYAQGGFYTADGVAVSGDDFFKQRGAFSPAPGISVTTFDDFDEFIQVIPNNNPHTFVDQIVTSTPTNNVDDILNNTSDSVWNNLSKDQKKTLLKQFGKINTEVIPPAGATPASISETTFEFNSDSVKKWNNTYFAEHNRFLTGRPFDGGLIKQQPRNWNEKIVDNVFAKEGGAAGVAKQIVESGVSSSMYIVFLQPTGRLIQRTGGSVIGLDGSAFAAYRLPRSWAQFTFYSGVEEIYHDAYIDLLFNNQIDNGDLLNKWVRWTTNLGEAAAGIIPKAEFDKTIKDWRENQERLERIHDGLVYVSTVDTAFNPETGSRKYFNITSQNTSARINTTSDDRLRLITIEILPNNEDKGPVVMAFGHHLNLQNSIGSGQQVNEGGEINIAEAQANSEGCAQQWATKDFSNLIPDNWPVVSRLQEFNLSAGTVMTGVNNNWIPIFQMLGGFGGPATFLGGLGATVTGQWLINKYVIDDCVDTTGGYYVTGHVEADESLTAESSLTQDVEEVVNFVQGTDETTPEVPGVNKGELQEIDQNIKDLLGETAGTHPKVVQVQTDAWLDEKEDGTLQYLAGSTNSYGLFSVWSKGECLPSALPGEEKTTKFTDSEGNVIAELEQGPDEANYCKNLETEDGEVERECLFSEDEARSDKKHLLNMAALDTTIGSYVIPQKVVRVAFNAPSPVIQVNVNPSTILMNESFFSCARDYSACNAVNLSGVGRTDVTRMLGNANQIVLDNGGLISITPTGLQLVGEQTYSTLGSSPSVEVNADGTVTIVDEDRRVRAGKLLSMQTRKASLVRENESGNNYLLWLKEIARASVDDIDGVDFSVGSESCNGNTVLNGFNLDFGPDLTSIQSQRNVAELNNAAASFGPFKVLETPQNVYYFYLNDECQQRMRIIDKETGEVRDLLVSDIRQVGENEFEVVTDEGTQNLKFDEKDGQVFVTVNDGIAELLTKLIGQNGTIVFDPESALYKALNAQTLPLIDAFKELGLAIKGSDDGRVVGAPGTNIAINVPGSQQASAFQLPWLPENPVQLALTLLLLLAGVLVIRARKSVKNLKN